ncbi:N-acetylgalactosamine kinase-like [Paramacrobiotus metropolitanus]|uniref:N-acetylgalactosamine kinase-like n=1 Tax=Paramacrobiotus metropolitanus TaxID=2943436 RepID=UPI0024461027|nr:N-acetylgalactosamine kinase-like [Paramacrobiotus metropolitanus]
MGESRDRLSRVSSAFRDKFGEDPHFVVRAPGRVNLIGEHIDYHGYPVLPMAISQDIVMAVTVPHDAAQGLRLCNVQSDRYRDFTSSLAEFNFNHMSKPQWHHYVLCGLKGVQEQLPVGKQLRGMRIMVDGSVPPNAGLSSSSALVCCAALAAMKANGLDIPADVLATICAKAEHYIGTEGGGMDQAISFLAQAGKAKLIEFDPLRSSDVVLPEDVVFVVANSCVELNKAATNHFNTRVAEGRIAVQILAHIHNLDWRTIKKASQLQKQLHLSLGPLLHLVDKTFKPEPYSRADVCASLGISEEELQTHCLSASTQNLQTFELLKRIRHVFSETDRVKVFKETCEIGKGADGKHECAKRLGVLMQDSHISCRDDYECSHPDLDDLVSVMQRSGAYGARLTGAGWGGCAVAIVPKQTAEAFLKKVEEDYFAKQPQRAAKLPEALFITSPSDGAGLIS